MQQDGPASDGEAQTYASACAISRFVDAKERIKDAVEQVIRNARTIVANTDTDFAVVTVHSHEYARPRWREPDRVAQNVLYGAAQKFGVTFDNVRGSNLSFDPDISD